MLARAKSQRFIISTVIGVLGMTWVLVSVLGPAGNAYADKPMGRGASTADVKSAGPTLTPTTSPPTSTDGGAAKREESGPMKALACSGGFSAGAIDSYLSCYSSPLSGTGNPHMSYGQQYNVDPRLVVAIAGAESSFGKNGDCALQRHNAWGYGGGWPSCWTFGSWDTGIEQVTLQLKDYIYTHHLTTIHAIGGTWCGSGCTYWETNVRTFYAQQGGNPDTSDLSYTGNAGGIDTQPPTLNWVGPVGNQQVYHTSGGAVLLQVSASDNIGVSYVHFQRWDAVNNVTVALGDVYSAPYQISLDVNSLNYDWNQVPATAYDAAGNQTSQYIWVYRDRVCTDDAQFVSQSVYPTVQPGQAFQIYFEVRNTGTCTWRPADNYYLGNINNTPLGVNPWQAMGSDVGPNATQRWTMNMTAPTTLGIYRTQWMVKHNDATFGPNMFIDVRVLLGPRTDDLNGDGTGDLLWRHATSGQDAVWLMNGASPPSMSLTTAVADTNWKIIGVGDLDRDAKTDLIWRNTASGQTAAWVMDGASVTRYALLPTVADAAWKLAAVADFNQDTKADLLWHNTTSGLNAVWMMNGSAVTSYAFLPSVADPNWTLVGVGDLNGDAKTDLVWRNTSSGQNVGWLMDGVTVASYEWLPTVSDMNWNVVGMGDLNGDHDADLVWHNASTGENVAWLMRGSSVNSYAFLPTGTDSNWKLVAVGDLDGDGQADLVWRNVSSGQNIAWMMNGGSVASYTWLDTVADTNWRVVSPTSLLAAFNGLLPGPTDVSAAKEDPAKPMASEAPKDAKPMWTDAPKDAIPMGLPR